MEDNPTASEGNTFFNGRFAFGVEEDDRDQVPLKNLPFAKGLEYELLRRVVVETDETFDVFETS